MNTLRLPENALPVCSANGSIREILLFYHCPVSENPALTGLRFSGLIDILGPQVNVYILIQLPHGTGIDALPQPAPNIYLIPINPNKTTLMHSLTSWTQDVVLSFEDNYGDAWLCFDENRVDLQAMEGLKVCLPDVAVLPHSFGRLAGGNLLPVIDRDKLYMIAGSDVLRTAENESAPMLSESDLAGMFGINTLIFPGRTLESGMLNGKQPLFHIDLYLCPLGRLVQDVDLQHILVAELKTEYCLAGESEKTRQLATALNHTATWLENGVQGIRFSVIRVPLLAFDAELNHIGSYTNAFAENSNGHCRLILPDYTPPDPQPGVNHLFKIAVETAQLQLKTQLSAAGVTEVMFAADNYYALSQREGALHCRAKVLSRTRLSTD
jgi:hypothetical protein